MMPEPVQTSPESLDAVLAALLEMSEQGQAADRKAWTSRYPQFAAELEEFFTSREHLEPWAAPLRSVARALVPTARPEESPTPGERPDVPVPAAPDRFPHSLPDYELLSEIGRGGMGVVYKARQKSLNRLVAVKLIRAGGLAPEDDLRRFRNEAEAVAHLDHAHIVAVHEVGEDADQHYFTMKLIEGGSLDRQLARFSAEPKAAARLLAAVARAVHHAHQRGILHRDLKPGNILIDAAGQPHVTDFGLAKRVEVDSSLTQSGVLIGTPSYMAPEQTSGVRGAITTATDVYGLGAVLYAMLTGQPPFRGDHVLETLRQVREQEPQSPSAVNPRVDRDLATITLKCLRKEPEQRYPSGEALADDLERWLKDEPIRAKRPSLLQRLVRWRRRHKPLVGSVAVLMILVLLLGGAVFGWQQRQLAATEQAIESDLREADLLQQQERWSDVLQVLERASGRLAAGGPSPLRERVEQRRTIVAMVAQLEEARLQGSAAGPEGFDYTGADQAYAAAFASYGLNLETLPPEEAAERIRTSPICAQLVAALDNWAHVKKVRRDGSEEPLWVVARLADDDAWRQKLRDPEVRKDRAAMERLAEAEDVMAQPPGNLVLLSWALDAIKGRAAAVRLLRRAQQRHPADFWINFELAFRLYGEPATLAEAIGFYRAALALRPHSPVIYNILGIALHDQKKLPEATAAYRQAIELKPDFAIAYYNLGNALRDQKKRPEAEAAWRKTIELKPDFPDSYINLGNALLDKKKLSEAEAVCRKAIEVKPDHAIAYLSLGSVLYHQGKLSEAVAAYRKAIDLKPDFALAYSGLGNALRHEKNLSEAEAACRKAIDLKPDFAEAYYNLGIVLYDQKKLPEAAAAYRTAIELKPDYAEAYCNLGGALLDQKKLAEAATAYRKAIELKPDLALAHRNIGFALLQQGKVDDAIAEYREAIRIKKDDSDAHNNLGVALWNKGQLDEAIAECREAIRIRKNNAEAHNSLGVYLWARGRLEEAIAEYREALSLKKDFPEGHSNLGALLFLRGQPDEAIAEFRKALRLNKDLPQARNNLGDALQSKGQLDEAIAEYREALRLKKDYAEAHCGLGDTVLRQGQFQQAVQELRLGHELGSRDPRWPHAARAAQQLRDAERLANLDTRLPALLKGEQQPKDTGDQLALAQMCQQHKKLYAAAARFFADAFAAQPALVAELQAGHRYNAACAAALAGCGQGKDASGLDDHERARLRKQAHDWLKADLTAWRNQLEKERDKAAPVALQIMQHWLDDTDLNGVRGAEALAKLPQAERADWQPLWEEVAALRQQARPKEK